jgi:hypothetical protein
MENENKPKNKKRYYKRRPKKNPADNAAASPNVSPSADPVAPNGSPNGSTADSTIATESRKPKAKGKGKTKPETDPRAITITWETAKALSATERGIDQIGLPALPKWTEPKKSAIEDANITASNNIATVTDNKKHIAIDYTEHGDSLKWNIDNSDDAKPMHSKSDYLLREHKLISAIALLTAFLGIVTVAAVWWMVTH